MAGDRLSKRPTRVAPAVPRDVCALPDSERPNGIHSFGAWDVRVPPGGERPRQAPERREWDVCRTTGWPDREIGDVASRQHGLITRDQLTALGMARAIIDHSVNRGRLEPIHRGVYAVGHVALPELARQMAALLAVGADGVLSHQSAAALWGLVPEFGSEVHVTIAGRDAGRRRSGIRVHRVGALDQRDTTTHRGIAITTPSRALLEIAQGLSARELERAFDEALTRRLTTRHAVVESLSRAPQHRGGARLAALATAESRSSTVTRSEIEERFLALIRRAGLPVPQANAAVGRFTVDFFWGSIGLVVEVDGYQFHSTHRVFEADRARDLELGAAGYEVMRFTWHQVVERPEFVLARLTQRMTELAAQSGRSSRKVS